MGVTGHAFPGIHALQEGASVDFQDYNAEVLEEVLALDPRRSF